MTGYVLRTQRAGLCDRNGLQQAQAIGALERDLRAEIKSRYAPKKDVE